MDLPRILVTRKLSIEPLAVLEPLLGKVNETFLLDAWDQEGPMPRALLLEKVGNVDALVCSPGDKIDEELLARAPKLRVVSNHAVGIDNLDLERLTERGIVKTHTPDVLTDATADLALALLLAVARHLPLGEKLVREGKFNGWSPRMLLGLELRGAKLGLFGFGRIGKAVAERAHAFGMEILYVANSDAPAEVVAQLSAKRVAFPTLLERSDVISLHSPLTPQTRHTFNRDAFARMKKGALLINTARGPIVDEEALADSLEAGHLGGTGLDVHEFEPQVNARLAKMDRVLLLPHLGSATADTRERMATRALTDAARVLRGDAPLHPIRSA